MEATVPSAQSNCGEWKIENAGSNTDQRIGISLLHQAMGSECIGTFTLKNQTGAFFGGGYSLELRDFSSNANIQYLPYGDPILIPGLDIEINTIPTDISKQASVNLQGEVTLGSFLAVDLSLFAMKSAIALMPVPTGCLISYDQIFLISLRTAPVLEKAAHLALQGDLIGSKEEFSRSLTLFYQKAADAAKDIGAECFSIYLLGNVLKTIVKKPFVAAQIILSYISWIGVLIFDYFEYQGFTTSANLSYIPATLSAATSLPSASPTMRVTSVASAVSLESLTVMLFDVSGSMEELDLTGVTKLDAAKESGYRILDIIQAENSVSQGAEIAILSFSDDAWVNSSLTLDVEIAQSALYSLYPMGGTGMPDGLRLAIDQFFGSQNTKPIIIMLSDGIPNIGLGGVDSGNEGLARQQVLDLASEAGIKGICIYSVGFGIPETAGNISGEASIDEDFLKQVAANSGCGAYYNAQNATELANVYVNLRHQSTGNILLSQTGDISQGQTVDIGDVQVPDDQTMILFTLNWPGSRLEAILVDPAGVTVDSNYPNASISIADTLASIIVQNPQPGQWKLAAEGVEVPEDTTSYNAVISARPNPNPPTTIPQETPQATIPTTPAFPLVILMLVMAGGGVFVYVMVQTRSRRRQGLAVGVTAAAQLVAVGGERSGQVIMLTDRLSVGRGSGCTLQLTEQVISRQHAVFRFAGGLWYIQDMKSKSGTFVNGNRVKATTLKDGDQIRIGSNIFEFHFGR